MGTKKRRFSYSSLYMDIKECLTRGLMFSELEGGYEVTRNSLFCFGVMGRQAVLDGA